MSKEIERDPRNTQLTGPVENTPWCDSCSVLCDRGYSVSYKERKGQEPLILQVQCMECRDKDEKAEYRRTGEITSRLMLLSSLRDCDKRYGKVKGPDDELDAVSASLENLQEIVTQFENEVWFDYMVPKVRNAELKGQSAESDHMKFLVWACAGRVMFTLSLKSDGSFITLITAENSDEHGIMGIQGLYATEDVAVNLLKNVLQDHREGLLDVVEDGEVSIAI